MLKCAPIISPDGVRNAIDLALDCYNEMERSSRGEDFFYRELEYGRINGAMLAGNLRMWGLADGELRAVAALEDGNRVKFIFVTPEYRRVGLGSVLIETMSDYAHDDRHDGLIAYATLESAGFFTRLGFKPCGAMEERYGLGLVPVKLEFQP